MINCVYIHIPFCQKKCKYCSFCSFETLSKKEIYLNALKKEIKNYYKNEPLKTIYFGGGTPSLLEVSEIESILELFNFSSSTEITLEMNPNDVTFDKLKDLKTLGVNRLSLGVQSFDNATLKEIGRLHNKDDIFRVVENIVKLGFDNFNIDLIYGLANQNLSDWIESLNIAKSLNPSHISLYGLKIEKGSYYFKYRPKNLPDIDLCAKMYEIAQDILQKDFLHYEFSNFARSKKYYSKHNLNYWKNENYYGFGLSASGYIENKRYTNTFDFNKYLKDPITKDFIVLSKKEKIEEEVFLGLRIIEGLDFSHINKKYDIDIFKKYEKIFNKYLGLNLMEKTQKGIKLSPRGQLVQNEILCEFIDV